jgi:anaerobic dimethyl sulfoxide reductase subunit B (iron-sulfur subunit)
MKRDGYRKVLSEQISFYVDATKCINCKTCEIACKDINRAAPGQRIRRVRTFEGGEYPRIFVYNISMSCNHCEDPKCVRVCPTGAYTKRTEDGIVVHNPGRCIGCRYCIWSCPYAAPQYSPREGKVKKCNMCIEWLKAGEMPACVAACPMRAIEVGPHRDFIKRRGLTLSIRNMPPPDITYPTALYKITNEASDRQPGAQDPPFKLD